MARSVKDVVAVDSKVLTLCRHSQLLAGVEVTHGRSKGATELAAVSSDLACPERLRRIGRMIRPVAAALLRESGPPGFARQVHDGCHRRHVRRREDDSSCPESRAPSFLGTLQANSRRRLNAENGYFCRGLLGRTSTILRRCGLVRSSQ